VTIYNHRASNSLLKILIDYVPFDMPSFRPGKNCMCRGGEMEGWIFLPSRVVSRFKINSDMTGELCIQQARHQETYYLKKIKNLYIVLKITYSSRNMHASFYYPTVNERQEEKKETETRHRQDMDPVNSNES
jgi:hypothetical protein